MGLEKRMKLLLASLLLFAVAGRAGADVGDCGMPLHDPADASDALFVLRTSVDLESCDLCVCDVNDSGETTSTDALTVLRLAVGLDVTLDCPACEPDDSGCPSVAQFALFSKIRGACASNSDCAPFSVCDTTLGRCRTGTEADVGWTGLSHDYDTDDPVPARVFLGCEGPAPCGQCEVTGHDPSLGNCRCENDNRQPCFTVAGPDEQFCGGAECICHFGPPLPLSSGNTPVCVLNTLASQPDGDVNVDEGSGFINLHLAEKIYLGISLLQPCPLCVDDPTPADGQRGGTCVGGANAGQTCDAQAYNATFVPPTGALYSLDCYPLAGANITGPGLRIETRLATGRDELHANVPCATDGPGSDLLCPCRLCTGDPTIACNSHAECEALSAGACASNGSGSLTLPNACDTGQCDDVGGEEGLCAVGPDDLYCDMVLRAEGTGLIGCGSNVDCEPATLGIDAGTCTLVERRDCFLDPIVTQGMPNPYVPYVGGTFCSPPTSSASVNTVVGLPGPGRLQLQSAVTLYCASDPQTTYTPGVGGCP